MKPELLLKADKAQTLGQGLILDCQEQLLRLEVYQLQDALARLMLQAVLLQTVWHSQRVKTRLLAATFKAVSCQLDDKVAGQMLIAVSQVQIRLLGATNKASVASSA